MKTFTISQLVCILRANGVDPAESFTAKAGKDYGHVNAWELGDGRFAIEYGNNGETNYDIADDADDLACWLESPDLGWIETIIQTANVRGSDAVDQAREDSKGPFRVLKTRYWYGSTETSDATDDAFDIFETAQKWIEEQESETYYTSHNESGAPAYKILTE